jgi:hypothetical protein
MRQPTAGAAAPAAGTCSRQLAFYRTALWISLLTYPLSHGMMLRSRALAEVHPRVAVVCFALCYLWSIAAPVSGWLALCAADRCEINRRERPQIVREAILTAVTPPFFVFSGAALGWLQAAAFQRPLWYAVVAGLAAAQFLPSPPRETSGDRRALRRAHNASALILLLFGLAHVANHLAALRSLHAHVVVQNWLRAVYRLPVVETLLVIAALVQVYTGSLMIARVRLRRGAQLRNLQLLAGAYLSMFFISHLSGVLISGRTIQKVDTTFAWSTGGPGGLLANPRSPQFFPYYSLGVLALFLHAAGSGRWSLARWIGPSAALKICYVVIGLGILVTLLLMFPMAGIHLA